jgi:hypothetical protein
MDWVHSAPVSITSDVYCVAAAVVGAGVGDAAVAGAAAVGAAVVPPMVLAGGGVGASLQNPGPAVFWRNLWWQGER